MSLLCLESMGDNLLLLLIFPSVNLTLSNNAYEVPQASIKYTRFFKHIVRGINVDQYSYTL